jgi:flagellar biosynthesis anti-sigma factor FlgM
MKITRRPTSGLSGIGIPDAIAADAAPERQGTVRGQDRIEISTEARLRVQLRREIGLLEDVPAARIAALRDEIARGAYQRDPATIAERLLADVAGELLG